jgi:hypothetical protein
MRKLWTAFLMMLSCLVAQGGERCQEVGGSILANLLNETGDIVFSTDGNFGTTSVRFVNVALASATGDLRGGVVVYILTPSMPSSTIRAHGNWVTESGDTIYTNASIATTQLIPGSNVAGSIYLQGLEITGGTGRFLGASGHIKILFGAGDLVTGQSVYRYQGTICVPESQD